MNAADINRAESRHLRSRARQILADRRSLIREEPTDTRTPAWLASWALSLVAESKALRLLAQSKAPRVGAAS